ncbi:MAG TPA: hopanoid-associated sugar epimerase [Polyangia bacterium]|jgi:dihydroflavonol-4-reductase
MNLVTGASGFIGSAVVRRLLARGGKVRCFVEPGARRDNLDGLDVEIVAGDVNDRDAVRRALDGCDTLFHLAAIYAIWTRDPSLIYRVNVEGSKTVLWAAYHAKVKRVVYTSSISAIGSGEDGVPVDETQGFSARDWDDGNAYIRSKWLSENDALRFAQEGLPLVVVNPAFPFGERDLGPTPTGGIILGALQKKIPGYVDAGFCAIDVDDCAEGHVLAAERGRVGERYILGNHNVTMRDFYRTVARVAGIKIPERRIPVGVAESVGWMMEKWADRSGKPPLATRKATRYAAHTHFFDNSKARRELGLPSTPLDVTIEKAVRWFRTHGYAG